MLKNNALKRIVLGSLALLIIIIIYFFPSKNIEQQDNITYINSLKSPIYLIDKNNYVARTNIIIESKSLADNIKKIIASLTINNSNTIYLPSGFNAIIPENTKIKDLSIKAGLLKINFSKELLNVSEENFEKMLEAITYSLTELNGIDQIMIFVEGTRLLKIPSTNVILPLTFDRSYGINKTYNINSIKNINKTTTYYLANNDNQIYYVPVTNIDNDGHEKIEIIINNLKTSPINQTNLTSFLASSTSLTSYQILENSISLSFNNSLIANLSNKDLLEEVQYSIFLSLKDSYNIKTVMFETPNMPLAIVK